MEENTVTNIEAGSLWMYGGAVLDGYLVIVVYVCSELSIGTIKTIDNCHEVVILTPGHYKFVEIDWLGRVDSRWKQLQ